MGTPNADDVGNHWIEIEVSDGEGGTHRTGFNLTVNDLPEIDFGSMEAVQLDDGNYMVFFHNGAEPNGLNVNYTSVPDSSGDVYYQVADPTGNLIGNPVVVNETTYHTQYNPKVLELADGTFVVAWSQSQSGNSFAVGYQRFDLSGNKVGNEVLLPTLNDPENTLVLTADANGGFEIYAGRTDETFFVDSLMSSSELNLNSGDLLTVVKGNEFLFDIDSATFEDQLVYSGPQILWGDMNWLSIDETGLLSGLVPLDFQNGAAEFFYDNGWQTNTINSVNFLSAWDSASWDEPVILLQPNTWSEQLQPIYFNSTDEDIIFGDALIESRSLKPGGVNTFTQDYFDISKEGLGILAYGSQFDDYFDFSGYSEDDFDYIDPNSGVYVSSLQLTVGNDVFIAPEIELDGKFVGQMSARRYFDDYHYGQNGVRQLDLDEGLLFEFLGDGAVLAHDTANGYVTQGFNVGNIQTSMFTDDTVIGDDGAVRCLLKAEWTRSLEKVV